MSFLFFIILAVWIFVLQGRVKALEDERTTRHTQSAPPPPGALAQGDMPHAMPYAAEQNFMPEHVAGAAPGGSPSVPQAPRENALSRFFVWLKEDFMVKLGAFLLLLALGWFVSYAIQNDWIGPMGQIALGVLVSVSVMVLGVWRIQTHPHQGGIFTVLGSAGVLLTIWAAREIYDFFTPGSALFLMALAVVFVAFVAVRYDRNSLALGGLTLAALAPLFTNSPFPNVAGLNTYLVLVVLGTLWVVYKRGWSNLTFAALVIVFLYGMPWLAFGLATGDRDIALFFAFLFTAIFFIANILGLIANENEENRKAHIAIAVGTGLYLIAWVTTAADEHWQSLLFAMWMLVFSVGSFIVYRVIESRVPFYIYGAASVALLAAATAAELEGPVLTIAFTIEVALLVFLTSLLLRDARTTSILAWLFIGPILLSLESLDSSAWHEGILHDDFFVLVTLGLSLAVVARFLYEKWQDTDGKATTVAVLTIVASLYGLGLIWLVLHAGAYEFESYPSYYDAMYYGGETGYYVPDVSAYGRATMLSLIIYTLIGLILFIAGKRRGRTAFVWGGGILLGLVVGRLLLVEVWQMELVIRILTFVVIGILLISTAFIRKQRKEALVTDNQPQP
jgi:uncharacterized membrane protein